MNLLNGAQAQGPAVFNLGEFGLTSIGRLVGNLAILQYLLAVSGSCQEFTIERADTEFLEVVQGSDGLILESFSSVLMPDTGSGTALFGSAMATGEWSLVISTRVLSLATVELQPTMLQVAFAPGSQELIVTWPEQASRVVLESTLDLGNADSWRPVSPTPEKNSFRDSLLGGQRFYRLRSD